MTLDVLDELEGVELARCTRCGLVAWGLGQCPDCSGWLRPDFHECDVIGWHAWPHRYLHDGRLLALEPLLFGASRLHLVADPWDMGSVDAWEYAEIVAPAALVALHSWNGDGEPDGWTRHRETGRRRRGGDPEQEHVMR